MIPHRVLYKCFQTSAPRSHAHGPNAGRSTPLQSHVCPHRHLRRSRDSDGDNDNDRALRLGRLRLSETRTTRTEKKSKMKSYSSTPTHRSIAALKMSMSLARPFDDLRRRDQVFLVVVIFKFEFVVCAECGVLNERTKSQYDTRSRRCFFFARFDRQLTRPWVGMSFGEATTSAR